MSVNWSNEDLRSVLDNVDENHIEVDDPQEDYSNYIRLATTNYSRQTIKEISININHNRKYTRCIRLHIFANPQW